LGAPIHLLDGRSLKALRRLEEAHTGGGVYHLAFSPDGTTLFSCGYDGRLRLWGPDTGKDRGEIKTHAADWFGRFAVSADGRRLAWGTDKGDIHVWDLAAARAVCVLRGHNNNVRAVAFSPDGRALASAGNDNTFR